MGNKLLVELRKDRYASNRSLLFNLQTESCESSLNDVQRLTPIKTDEDNRALACWTPENLLAPSDGGTLRVFRQPITQTPEETWKYADQHLKACGDVDGDGIEDAIGAPDKSGVINMVSGATGNYLWSVKSEFVHAAPTMSDFDGDGVPDVVFIHANQNPHTKTDVPIALASGRTGQMLWRLKLDKKVDWIKQRVVVEDIDDNGQPDLLVFAETNYLGGGLRRWDMPWSVFQINGGTGKLMYSRQLGDVGRHAGKMFASYQEFVEDLNDDQFRDVVGYGVDSSGMLCLRAMSGRDGTELWGNAQLPVQERADNRTRYPHFCSIETDESTTIVSAATLGYQSNKQQLLVKAIDGVNGSDLWEWTAPMLSLIHI